MAFKNKILKDNTPDLKVVNNIKALGIDMINDAASGHPGIVLGAAPIMYRLYSKHLIFNPENPNWINRDRFVMSCGHGSALLYATLFMSGFDLTIQDLKNFRKYGSKTPGHPEVGQTPGVDASTGPLGQGLGVAVGMAIGEAYLNQKFKNLKSSLINHYTYALVSDGDLMEGISYEASSLAGSLGLGKLIVLYDSNGISLDGKTDGVFDEDILERFKSMGWDTHLLEDPYNFEEFDSLIEKSKSETTKPSLIQIKTVLGKDSKHQNTNQVHGKPLSKDDIKHIKKKLGIRDVSYTVLSDACNYMKSSIDERIKPEIKKWQKTYERLQTKLDKSLLKDFERINNHDLDIDIKKSIFKLNPEKSYSGRDLAGHIINKLKTKDIMCLTTDTGTSTKAMFKEKEHFTRKNRALKNISCGVRELGTSAIANGLSLMGIRTITSTFLSFSNYMIPSIRMASLMNLNNIYIFTHDSVLVGEDGPTHQPIEQIDMLRLIPNVTVFRPCDRNEIIGCLGSALKRKGPTVIVLSKYILPTCKYTNINKTKDGGYILKDKEEANEQVSIIASGSEVQLALDVSSSLEKHMITSRVISMPSLEEFEKLKKEEQEKILLKDNLKVVIELSSCSKYYKYVTDKDLVFNVNNYMKSGNKYSIIHRLSYDVDSITKEILENLKQRM